MVRTFCASHDNGSHARNTEGATRRDSFSDDRDRDSETRRDDSTGLGPSGLACGLLRRFSFRVRGEAAVAAGHLPMRLPRLVAGSIGGR